MARKTTKDLLKECIEALGFIGDEVSDLGCNCGWEKDGSPYDCRSCRLKTSVTDILEWVEYHQ